jgi:hypothetical protein
MTETNHPGGDQIVNIFRAFENSNFDIVSDFGFRASSFGDWYLTGYGE